MSKAIVLGLDGACWPLLEDWLSDGALPHLAQLRQRSAWGTLLSELPPVTSPNWHCYATGCNPAKVGVFWWEIVDRQRQTIRHPRARDYHRQTLWSLLDEAAKRVAVLNFPCGYPPAPLQEGYFTAGGPGAKETGFAYPPRWESELKRRFGYRVHPSRILSSVSDVERAQEEILRLIQTRFDAAFRLLDKNVDFLHITIFYINVLQHFLYQGEATKRAWQLIDHNLGRLCKRASAHGYNLFLMSDHGCARIDTVFHINTWLQQQDYLHLNRSPAGQAMIRLGLSRQRLVSWARRLGVARWASARVPQAIQEMVPDSKGTYQKQAKAHRIRWHESAAVGSGQGLVYLLRTRGQAGYEELKEKLQRELRALRRPGTGEPVAAKVHFRADIYEGPFLDSAPDIVFEQAAGVHTSGSIGHPEIFERTHKWAAENVPHGLFLAWGPDIAASGKLEPVRILDLAPTLLHLSGVGIPEDIDGRVLHQLLARCGDDTGGLTQ